MSKKFLSNTPLAGYEALMQETSSMLNIKFDKESPLVRYVSALREYLKGYGQEKIGERVIKTVAMMSLDEIVFLDQSHRMNFLKIFYKWTKAYGRKTRQKTAAIYLLCANDELVAILEKYISTPKCVLPKRITCSVSEDTYAIYHAVKMILELPSGLKEEELCDEEVLSDKVLCLIMNAKFINRYGLTDFVKRPLKKERIAMGIDPDEYGCFVDKIDV